MKGLIDMKSVTFLFSILFSIGLNAGIISDINDLYFSNNENSSIPDAPKNRLEFIISNANNIVSSYTLMKSVNKEISETNKLVDAEFQRQWRIENPKQKFTVSINAVWASNDVNNATLLSDWLANNPTNGLTIKSFRCRTNKNDRIKNSYVSIKTNWLFTVKEKNSYKRLKKQYQDNKYDIIASLSPEDYVTYTNQTAKYREITKDLKIISDNYNYMVNYNTITNKRYQIQLKKKQKEEAEEAERLANELTKEQEERYYEIIDEMEDQGIDSEYDVKLLKSVKKNRNLLLASNNEQPSFSAKLRFIKSLSKEDQRIFKVGNKKLRNNKNENLYNSLSETNWQKYRTIRDNLARLDTSSEKLDYMKNLSDEDKLIYRSGKYLIREMKKAAKIKANKK